MTCLSTEENPMKGKRFSEVRGTPEPGGRR